MDPVTGAELAFYLAFLGYFFGSLRKDGCRFWSSLITAIIWPIAIVIVAVITITKKERK